MSRRIDPKFSGVVTPDGVLKLDASDLFVRHLKRLANQPIELVIRKLARPKSHSLLGYLWGVLYPVAADEFGYASYELDALHDACIRKLRGLKPDPNPLGLRVSLAEMSHDEASDYVSDLRHWLLTDFGIVTPDASKVDVPALRKAS